MDKKQASVRIAGTWKTSGRRRFTRHSSRNGKHSTFTKNVKLTIPLSQLEVQ